MSTSSPPAKLPSAAPPSQSPSANSAVQNTEHPSLHPLITSPPACRSPIPRPMSHASKNRLSQYSTGSIPSRSRPPSYLFPIFHSSLSYTIVRDFAYPPLTPLHYGPPPEPSRPPSGMATPSGELRRLSDPPGSWESKLGWEWAADGGFGKGGELAPIHFGDGPPWSEDEDLQSPVVSSRHRKHKSTSAALGHGKPRGSTDGKSSILHAARYEADRGYYIGTGGDGSERYYVSQGVEANGPGGEFVTYPPDQARHSTHAYQSMEQRPRRYAENDPGYRSESEASSVASSPGFQAFDESRYSRDYQFTITSPDEEMHGKAVALFDFRRENENELPLAEGQIIWVSYRHGEGWLVAEDPKTQESGLVPEEYVRLLRDIEGGMTSLTGQVAEGPDTPNEAGTPTQAEHSQASLPAVTQAPPPGHVPTPSNALNGYHQPVVSTFSTSSKDLNPYPQHLLGQHGQPPPQVVHYHGQRGGSQANTPTAQNSFDTGLGRRGSQDVKGDAAANKSQSLETLPVARMKSPADESDSEEDESPNR
ncbi:Uu.00g035700.m01.CDS01 [Anthostomella pinea]|uniref:Uu.00g035700.m01.CDS01 n=1 Tax=Anthostomella pinea TaxID=933095 RepID=A0AAI8YDH2_9PEZI|nr:Uu.00g035700.m01.CDS01 [Anthostomella pinea]